jgi:hypothetical protein
MTFRHATALALVGWYLMAPPRIPGRNDFRFNAPISEWQNQGAFDTADECQKIIAETQSQMDTWPEFKEETNRAAVRAMQCISTDDPRLKRN